ncbi:hypothetical protein [Cellulomonas massiliensis]|uniref:hypothetical protein n=1 Tax=Cellulomonas massiliensis TaxID=1465811 RepID=UPI000307D15A|nr:hypothetical protein [Cellulomonas massiliensis]
MNTAVRRYGPAAAITAGMLGAALLVAHASSAAFTAQTSTAPNTFTAATVEITNDQEDQVAFSPGAIQPGVPGHGDVTVTYDGTASADVRLYTSDESGSAALADALQVTITSGTAADPTTTTVFDGTLAELGDHVGFAETSSGAGDGGLGAWDDVAQGDELTYRVTWELPADADNALQGETAELALVWEAQSRLP